MNTVLFVSMHDTSRGPMAAALFNAIADPSLAVASSAGFRPGGSLDQLVVSGMANAGVPLPDHHPQRLTYELLKDATLIVYVGNGGAPPRTAENELFWNVPLIRPANEEGVALVRRDLEKRIGGLIADRAWRQSLPCASHG